MTAQEDLMKQLYDDHQLNDQTNPTHCTCGHYYPEGGRMAQVINHHIIMAASIGWETGRNDESDFVEALEDWDRLCKIAGTPVSGWPKQPRNPYEENQ